jgi:hypothetical protein
VDPVDTIAAELRQGQPTDVVILSREGLAELINGRQNRYRFRSPDYVVFVNVFDENLRAWL